MKLLFICTHNACRSILCEVVARKLVGDRIGVASAGSNPAGQIHPLTLEYLQSHGYDTLGLASKSLDDVKHLQPDVVITVCDSAAREGCPAWLGAAVKAHWGLVDPTAIEGDNAATAAAFDAVVATTESRMLALQQQPFESMDDDQLAALLKNIAGDD